MPAFGGDGWQAHDGDGRRKYLNAGERVRFLAAADRLAPAPRALCYVLAFAGCRISEALALTVGQVDAERQALTIRTLKRRRAVFRAVPVPPELVAMLQALPRNASDSLWPLHRVTAWRVVKQTMQNAEIDGPMACPKGLRHGFGIRAVERNVPVNLIQRWLGHASPVTTAVYLDAVGIEERRFAERLW